MRDDDGTKWLDASVLADILMTLPEDSRVIANAVGNLLVLVDDEAVGYIDFVDGSVEMF